MTTGWLDRARRRLGNAWHPRIEISSCPNDIQVDWDVPVKVRDGTTLRVNVFRPKTADAVPVIMSAHPYGKDAIPAKTANGRGVNKQYRAFPQPRPIRFSAWTNWEAPDPVVWVQRGYAVVNADLRGGGTAEGVGEPFSDEEATDYYDLIEWAGTQPWSSGRVGLDGVSYLAISQYKVAALHPPHLAAICPWEGFSDLYRDFARPGGVREDGFVIMWSFLTRKLARLKGNIRAEVVARPERDAWYEARTPALERIEVPVLVCGSFSDHSLHSRGSFEVFRRAGSTLKRLYTHRDGKWCAYYSEAATEARARFFDFTLKQLDNGLEREPAVRIAIHDEGAEPIAVVMADAWPPRDLAWTRLYLDPAARALRPAGAPAEERAVTFSTRGRGVHFDWVAPGDVDIIGPMALRLHVSLAGAEDAVLFVGVRKFRAGREVLFEGSYGFAYDLVTRGWQRLAHRTLDGRLSTPEQPVHRHDEVSPFKSGEIVPVDIALLPQATRLLKGDTLRLEIRGTWFHARNPLSGQFPVGYQVGPRATCTVHGGGRYESGLLVGQRAVGNTRQFR